MTAQLFPFERSAPQSLRDFFVAEVDADLLRRRSNRSQLAATLNISQPTLSKRLNGKQPMTLEFVEEVCAVLDLNLWVGKSAHPDGDTPNGASVPSDGLEPSAYRLQFTGLHRVAA